MVEEGGQEISPPLPARWIIARKPCEKDWN